MTEGATVVAENAVTALSILVVLLVALATRTIGVLIIDAVVRKVSRDVEHRRTKKPATKSASKSRASSRGPRLSLLATERVLQRTRALASLSKNVLTVLVVLITFFVVLSQLGVNITAMLASAGVVAAGLAFGAQNIIKDLLNGIFMVIEDQLGVGDSVKIGDVEGTVEVVNLRVTQVRAYDGTLWFIRNGEILRLGNLSHGWGRAIMDVSVTPDSNLTKVRSALEKAAEKVSSQPGISSKLTGSVQVSDGFIHVSDDRITFRITAKTKPEAQADVETALLAQVKTDFDRLKIRFAPDASALVLYASDARGGD